MTTDDTAPQEPTTVAGRRYLYGLKPHFTSTRDAIRAIEAEARADALREAAERVRGLPWTHTNDRQGGHGVALKAVLAILDPEATR